MSLFSEDNWQADSVQLALLILYITMLIVSIVMFVKYMYQSRFFIVGFLIGTILRIVFFAFKPFTIEGDLRTEDWVGFEIATLPSFIYFSVYMMELFAWGELYMSGEITRTRLSAGLRSSFIAVNAIIYSLLALLYMLDILYGIRNDDNSDKNNDHVLKPKSIFEKLVILYCSITYAVVSIGFLIYVYYQFKSSWSQSFVERSLELTKVLRKTSSIILVCMFCFIVRAIFVTVCEFSSVIRSWWLLDGIYLFALEWIPMMLLLGTFLTRRDRYKAFQYLKLNAELESPLISKE